jgi:hypothetical protein
MVSKIPLLLCFAFAMMGCSTPAPEFHLMRPDAIAVEQAMEVDINNCGNPLPRIHWERWSENAEMGVDNLKGSGGEAFTAIREILLQQHGQLAPTQMTIPPNTHVIYTFTVQSTRVRGEVVGAAIAAQKEHPTLPTYYSYLAPQNITLSAHEDRPCP